jgi:hypothetical protein
MGSDIARGYRDFVDGAKEHVSLQPRPKQRDLAMKSALPTLVERSRLAQSVATSSPLLLASIR